MLHQFRGNLAGAVALLGLHGLDFPVPNALGNLNRAQVEQQIENGQPGNLAGSESRLRKYPEESAEWFRSGLDDALASSEENSPFGQVSWLSPWLQCATLHALV